MNLLKVMRAKCLECCCDNRVEVAECGIKACPLHPYRMGKNPFRVKRVLTDEQRKAAGERFAKAREAKQNEQ